MSLEGKLKDFGIADILQLLAQQQKTGILLVERGDESAEIYFSNGRVIETRSSQHTDRLGEMLIRGGFISRQQVDAALANQGESFDYLGKILVRDGLIQNEVLQQALLTQTIETFFDILQWLDGHYRFVTDKYKTEGVLENIPGVQSILLDVLRMIDEWPEIQKVIPSLDTVYELNDGHAPDDIEVDELPVYQLIDGKRSVYEVVDGSLLGRYAACKILVELLQDGIIKPGAGKASGGIEQGPGIIEKALAVAAYALPALLLIAAVYLPTGFPASMFPVLAEPGKTHVQFDGFCDSLDRQLIRYALDAYYFKYGHYPQSLTDLVNDGLVPSEDIVNKFSYSTKRSHYDLGRAEQ